VRTAADGGWRHVAGGHRHGGEYGGVILSSSVYHRTRQHQLISISVSVHHPTRQHQYVRAPRSEAVERCAAVHA
jgi:hypothetical protein